MPRKINIKTKPNKTKIKTFRQIIIKLLKINDKEKIKKTMLREIEDVNKWRDTLS